MPLGLRAALAVEAFRHTAAYDARIAAELPCRFDDAGIDLPPDPGLPRARRTRSRPSSSLPLEKVETLRYGENPHQPAARYRRTDRRARADDGPFASGAPPLQGKALSYNNVLDASAAAAIARQLRGPACVVVKHTNPCGAAERATLLDAWHAALAGDPEAAFGGVVALTRPVTRRRRGRPHGHLPRGRGRTRVRTRGPRAPRVQAEPPPRRGPGPRRGPAGSPGRTARSASTSSARSGPRAARSWSARPTTASTTQPSGQP